MPWKASSLVQQRQKFIDEYMMQEGSVAELARRFEISRKTAYKWIDRFLAGCELSDRSRRPRSSPRAVRAEIEYAIVAARRLKPRWGPRKLRAALERANPRVELPSVGTFALIFKRNGLVVPRRRRHRTPPSSAPLSHATGPNFLWCIDFKGDFLVGKRRCYPLTVTDAYSRYLIAAWRFPIPASAASAAPCWRLSSSSAFPTRSAATTARRSRHEHRPGCPRCRPGG